MFRNIYRALVLSRTKSAAIQIANQLDQRDLNDIGVSRYELVQRSVESVRKEFDQADCKRAQEAGSKVAASNVLSAFIANSLLRPLGSTRSYD
jgi:uncharacterized protein YjiS (DUF1127 family)